MFSLREKKMLKNLELLQRCKIVFTNSCYLEFSELVAAVHNYAGLLYVDFHCSYFPLFFVVRIDIC